MILQGKRVLIAGMSDRRSIGYSIAQEAQRQGAEILLTSFGRMMTITQMTAKKLDPVPEILEMDVTKPADIANALKETSKRWDRLDGLVHSVAYAPPDALGGNFLHTPWESVATALQVSAFSFKELASGFLPLMKEHGGSMVTLDFDNSTQAWPKYDWMGVSRAALESVTRYLARDLGRYKIRVNAVCAGPLATLAASGIPGFKDFEEVWGLRAPLGWNLQDRTPVGRAVVALLSDYLNMTTGELLHVDGGYHAMGADIPPADYELASPHPLGPPCRRRGRWSQRRRGSTSAHSRCGCLSATTSSGMLVTSPQPPVRICLHPELRSQGGTVIAGVPGDLCGRRSRQKRPGGVWPGRFH